MASSGDIEIWDVIIIGGGVAAYTAGIYTSRAKLTTLVLEGENWGGQLMTTDIVENFPAFPEGISGFDLVNKMRDQSLKYGAIHVESNVNDVQHVGEIFVVAINDKKYTTRSIIVATGAIAKVIEYPSYIYNDDEQAISAPLEGDPFWNHGISACAVCDGALPIFRRKPIYVVGGGDSACEMALYLTKYASEVHILVRSSKMRASAILQDRVQSHPKITLEYNTNVESLYGEVSETRTRLSHIRVRIHSETRVVPCSGLFFAIGHQPNTTFLNGLVKLDDHGFIVTQNTVTNVKGVFACGDVQDPVFKQAITACGTGCQAALACETYVSSL